MATLNFPPSPVNGQIYSSGSTQWKYDAVYGVWNIFSSGPIGYTGSTGYVGSASTVVGYSGSIGYTGSSGYVGSASTAPGYTGSKGALLPWTVQNALYNSSDGERILADSTSGSFTINLPATPAQGCYVQISDGNDFSVYPVTVGRNGSTIEGISDDVSLDLKGATFEFIYGPSTWQVTATTGAKGNNGYTGSTPSAGLQATLSLILGG